MGHLPFKSICELLQESLRASIINIFRYPQTELGDLRNKMVHILFQAHYLHLVLPQIEKLFIFYSSVMDFFVVVDKFIKTFDSKNVMSIFGSKR